MSGCDLTVILADGDFPSAKQPMEILHSAARIVCCDGAAIPLLQHGMEPDRIVGDLDSLPPAIRTRYPDRLIHESEQDDNDLTKAFRYCIASGWRDIVILGATGKREDHTLGNLSHLGDYAKETPDIRLVSDYGVFTVALTGGVFCSVPGERVSFFALDEGTFVSSRGLQYEMDHLHLAMWWQATLNCATGSSFTLEITHGKRLLVFRAFPHNL